MKIVIAWTNKFSGDTGFVKSVNPDGKDFVNAETIADAAYFTHKTAEKHITGLIESQPQNDYGMVNISEESEKVKKPAGRKPQNAAKNEKPADTKPAPEAKSKKK